jgi:hypothetical protein
MLEDAIPIRQSSPISRSGRCTRCCIGRCFEPYKVEPNQLHTERDRFDQTIVSP